MAIKVSRNEIRKLDRTEKHNSSFGKLRAKKSQFVSKKIGFTFSACQPQAQRTGKVLTTGRPIIASQSKFFLDFISKLDNTEKRDINFSNLCMKKGGSFPKVRFLFLL